MPSARLDMPFIVGASADARVAETGGLGAPVSGEGALNSDEAGSAFGTGGVRVDALFADKTVRVSSTGGGAGTADAVLDFQRPKFDGRK